MAESSAREIYWAKANENLLCAESEFESGRYNTCVARCYYAAFQGAIVALLSEGLRAPTSIWGHGYVQAQFAGQLIVRRKVYSSGLRDVLPSLMALREKADYEDVLVNRREASRAVREVRSLLHAVAARQERGG